MNIINFDLEKLLKLNSDRFECELATFWDKHDSKIGSFLESILTKSMHKADADFDDVTQEVKICLFKALKENKYNSKKATFKGFAAMVLSRKRVDVIRRIVRNRNNLNKLYESSKNRNKDDFSVQENAIFNEYKKKWNALENQLPEAMKLILSDIGRFSSREIMTNHNLSSVQLCRFLKNVHKMVEDSIFCGSKV